MRTHDRSLMSPMLEDYTPSCQNTLTLERYMSGSAQVVTAKEPQTFDELFTR